MYILVEKDLATKKRKKIIHNLENLWLSKSPFAIFKWMYLIVDYPTKKKTLERLILRCCAVNGAKHVKRTKIRNPRVYIYRATSVMLKSLCVFFFCLFSKAAVSVCGIVFPTKHSLRCWSSVSRLSPLGGEAVRWVVAEVAGCSGGEGGGVWQNGTRESAGLWVLCRRCVSLLASRPYFLGVHSTSLLYARHGSRRPPLDTHAHRAAYTWEQTLHSSRHERSWVVKALALSGNSWLGRHGGSWLLLVL